MDYDSSFSSSSADNTPALTGLQPPCIEEAFATVEAPIKAVDKHAQKQGFAVFKRQSKMKEVVCTVYLRCDKEAIHSQRQPL